MPATRPAPINFVQPHQTIATKILLTTRRPTLGFSPVSSYSPSHWSPSTPYLKSHCGFGLVDSCLNALHPGRGFDSRLGFPFGISTPTRRAHGQTGESHVFAGARPPQAYHTAAAGTPNRAIIKSFTFVARPDTCRPAQLHSLLQPPPPANPTNRHATRPTRHQRTRNRRTTNPRRHTTPPTPLSKHSRSNDNTQTLPQLQTQPTPSIHNERPIAQQTLINAHINAQRKPNKQVTFIRHSICRISFRIAKPNSVRPP